MSVTEVAIVVIAFAVTAQTLMMAVGLVAGMRAWRTVRTEVEQMQAALDQRLEAVSARIDEAVVDARIAARAVENLATRADDLMQNAASAAHSVGTAVTFPKAVLLSGAASAAKWVLSKWRPRRPRSVGPVDSLGSAEVF